MLVDLAMAIVGILMSSLKMTDTFMDKMKLMTDLLLRKEMTKMLLTMKMPMLKPQKEKLIPMILLMLVVMMLKVMTLVVVLTMVKPQKMIKEMTKLTVEMVLMAKMAENDDRNKH